MADWTLHRGAAPRRKIPLWVEPYAGSLAVGLRLLGASHLVGWMGGKSRYADAIMSILNVDACDEVWCADISPWAACWRALSRPRIAKAAADIIEEIEADALSRGDCPASYRAVWLELREEHRLRPMAENARAVAVWLALVAGSAMQRGPENGCRWHPERAEWRRCVRDGHQKADRLASKLIATRLRSLPDPLPLRVWGSAEGVPVRSDAVVLLDPPYDGTAGYGYGGKGQVFGEMTRRIARRWLDAGARVATCEQTPMEGGLPYDLTGRAANTTGGRVTGRVVTREVLTVFEPGRILPLFGVLGQRT